MTKTYSLLLNIEVKTQEGTDGRNVRTYKFKGWKNAVDSDVAFEWSEEYSQSKSKSMQKLGELLFDAAKNIVKDDD